MGKATTAWRFIIEFYRARGWDTLRVEAFSHPDVIWVVARPRGRAGEPAPVPRPEPRPPGFSSDWTITIERVREVAEELAKPPVEGGHRFVVVVDADQMTPEAQAAFLKALEEPDARTTFILITSRPEDLLATIRSRTRPIRFRPLSFEEFKGVGWPGDVPVATLYRLSGGSVGQAKAVLASGLLGVREAAARALLLEPGALEELFGAGLEARTLVGVLQSVARDALFLALGAKESVINSDLVPLLGQVAGRYEVHSLARVLSSLGRAERRVSGGKMAPLPAVLAALRPLAGRRYLDVLKPETPGFP